MTAAKSILVVEDNKTDSFIIQKVINGYDPAAEMLIFNQPEKGLQFLKGKNASAMGRNMVILLDIGMPDIDGWQFIEEFEKLPESIQASGRVYILTSSIDPGDRQKAGSLKSVVSYFSRPLTTIGLKQINMDDREA